MVSCGMVRLLVIIFSVVSLLLLPAFAYSEQALLILTSKEFRDTELSIDKVKSLGVNVQHVIPPAGLIAEIPPEMDDRILAIPGVSEIYRGSATLPKGALNASTEAAAAVWNRLAQPSVQSPGYTGKPLVGDAFEPPVLRFEVEQAPPLSSGLTRLITPTSIWLMTASALRCSFRSRFHSMDRRTTRYMWGQTDWPAL